MLFDWLQVDRGLKKVLKFDYFLEIWENEIPIC